MTLSSLYLLFIFIFFKYSKQVSIVDLFEVLLLLRYMQNE